MQVNYKIIVSSGTGTRKPSFSTTTIEIIRKIFVKAMSHKSVRDILKKYQLEKLEAAKAALLGLTASLGISLFGKNGNFFTATKIWASMTKIGRSMG